MLVSFFEFKNTCSGSYVSVMVVSSGLPMKKAIRRLCSDLAFVVTNMFMNGSVVLGMFCVLLSSLLSFISVLFVMSARRSIQAS